jgi:hypothetical protein
MKSSIYNCSLVELPRMHDRSGNLTCVDNLLNIPYDIKRIYYLYDVPSGENRGGHAHKLLHEFLVAVSGGFEVMLNDGFNKKIVWLDRPYLGLHIVPGIWRELHNFTSGAICLVLASMEFEENDYIREFNEFRIIKER